MRRRIALVAAGLLLATASAAQAAPAAALKLERVVVLMRHGVRPPTKDPALKPGLATLPGSWPTWPVAPGALTQHGARAIEALGAADRARFAAAGLFQRAGCPGSVAMVSDSDQRTIATGDAYLAGFAPGCAIANGHEPQGVRDALFSPIEQGLTSVDTEAAKRDVAELLGAGGVAGLDARMRPALARLRAIFCGSAPCPLTDVPSAIAFEPGRRPKLTGALDSASTAAQILLLEYAEGKPTAEVGWGAASAADIRLAGQLHSAEFSITARPHAVAAANIKPIAERALVALTRADAPRLSLIVGHDTNVASLGGLLDLHWAAPGYADDDPAPGGALVLELLDGRGDARFVRISYRAQSLDALRSGSGASVSQVLRIPGCGNRALCRLADFERLVRARVALAGSGKAH